MLSWLRGSRDVYAVIAHGNYSKAVQMLERQLRKEPDSVHLRQLLADVFERMGKPERAVPVLEPLVDKLAEDGFAHKSIAVLKKIQRIDPEKSNIDLKLATLIEQMDDPPGSALPLIEAHLEDEAPQLGPEYEAPLAEGGQLKEDGMGPEYATSFLRADWFEEAEQRTDFHWSPLLASFSRSELAAVIGGLRLLVKRPGAIIYGEDAPGDSMFVLSTGKARIYRRDGRGHYQQVGILREGEFFGEASVLSQSNRLSTITAASDCELLELDKKTFDRIAERFPRVRQMVQQLYDRRVSFETAGLD